MTTFLSLVNPAESPVQVAIRYVGVAGSCQGQTYNHPGFTLAGGASALVTQAPGQALLGTGVSPLPAGCTAAAIIESTGLGLVAAVVDRHVLGGSAQAYTALTPAQGATTVHMPDARKQHGGNLGVTTAIHVINMGSQAAEVSIRFETSLNKLVAGCTGCQVTLPPGGGHLFWPGAIPELDSNTYGSARVIGDQPIGVVVNAISVSQLIDMASYVGLCQATPPPDQARSISFSPLYLSNDLTVPLTATPTHGASTATPTAIQSQTWRRFMPSLVKDP